MLCITRANFDESQSLASVRLLHGRCLLQTFACLCNSATSRTVAFAVRAYLPRSLEIRLVAAPQLSSPATRYLRSGRCRPCLHRSRMSWCRRLPKPLRDPSLVHWGINTAINETHQQQEDACAQQYSRRTVNASTTYRLES